MARTIEIDADIFENLLWERVSEFGSKYLDNDFWDEAIPFLMDNEVWEGLDISHRDPMYIIDNIAINGEIKTADELIDEYDYGLESEDDVEEMADNEGWDHFGDYYILSWGI